MPSRSSLALADAGALRAGELWIPVKVVRFRRPERDQVPQVFLPPRSVGYTSPTVRPVAVSLRVTLALPQQGDG